MRKLFLNFEEMVSRAHGNSEEQNKVFDSSMIIINYLLLIYIYTHSSQFGGADRAK